MQSIETYDGSYSQVSPILTISTADFERYIDEAASKAVANALDTFTQVGLLYSPYNTNLENGIPINESLLLTESEVDKMGSKYHERVKIGTDASGKAIYKDVYGNSREAIQLKTARMIAEREGNVIQFNRAVEPRTPLWEAYAQEWYDTFKRSKLKPKAQTKYDNLLKKHVIPALQGKHVDEIKPADVQEVLNARGEYAASYLRDIKNLIAQVLDSAVDDDLIVKNPARSKRVNIPSRKETERWALTPEQKADIIANIPNLSHKNDRIEVALLMFGGGMRPGEMFGLRYENIDRKACLACVRQAVVFTKGKEYIGDPKTAKGRIVPLDPRLFEYLEDRTEGFVLRRDSERWATGKDEPYTEQVAKRAWERIKKEINVYGMTPYIARHTYATELQRGGVAIKTSIEILGHKDERMLSRIYAHNDQRKDVLQAAEAMRKYYQANGI